MAPAVPLHGLAVRPQAGAGVAGPASGHFALAASPGCGIDFVTYSGTVILHRSSWHGFVSGEVLRKLCAVNCTMGGGVGLVGGGDAQA